MGVVSFVSAFGCLVAESMAIGGLPGAAMRGVQSMPREESRGDAGGSGRRDEEAGGGGGGRWDGKRGMVRAVENWQRSRAKLMAKRSP